MFKVVFVSNFFNHHQKPFSDLLYEKLNGNYSFIESSDIDEERINLGWSLSDYPDYVFRYLKSPEKCREIINKADVVIYGNAPEFLVDEHLRKGKLAFRYSERIYKNGYNCLKLPVRIIKNYKKYGKYKNLYLLCAGAYVYNDYAKTFNFKNKAYKWGYFPELIKYENISQFIDKKVNNSILWCGRLIDWKHPDYAINLAINLKNCGYDFRLTIVGTGPMEEQIKLLIKQNSLDDYVCLTGSMPPEEVRKYMEQSQIFLFTSDKKEGWGAVLNEAMNSACGVVAGKAPGSVPFLVQDGYNGLIYNPKDDNDLFVKVKYLLDNKSELKAMSERAYCTVYDLWNADSASDRFIELTENILNGNLSPNLFSDGPCSKAVLVDEL